MNQRVVCIWLPNWPSQRVAVATWQAESRASETDPSERSAELARSAMGPRVLYANDARRGRIVAAANATARQRGILPPMTLAQLSAMCPEAVWSEHDPNADLEELTSLAEQLQQFSPIVGLECLDKGLWSGRSMHQPQSILLDATGTSVWFGGEKELAAAIHAWFSERGYVCCIGVAGSVGAAWAIANYTFRDRIAPAMIEIESARGRPIDHAWHAVLESTRDPSLHFAKFPVEALRLDHEVIAKLRRLGVRSLESLLQLPRSALTSRFGPRLLERIDHCFGNRTEPIRVQPMGIELQSELEWEHPIRDLEALGQRLFDVTQDLCKRLVQQGHGALRLVCRLILERQSISVDETHASRESQAHILQLSLFQASQDPSHIVWLFMGQLELNPPRLNKDIAIRGLRIEANVTAPLHWRQTELFEESNAKHRDAIAKLIDSLSARLGRNQVVAPGIIRDPLPERQVRMRPLTGLRADGRSQDTKRKLSRAPKRDFSKEQSLESNPEAFLSRPVQLAPTPIPIDVEVTATGQPASVSYKNQRWAINELAGPERIESGWWSGPSERREYYRVVLATGDWWWIFRDLKQGQWFLHGAFA